MSGSVNRRNARGMLLGEVASSGLARGRALLCDCTRQTVVSQRRVSGAEVRQEIARFDAAVSAAEVTLGKIQLDVHKTVGSAEAEIFGAQILLLRDPQLRDTVLKLCTEKQLNVEAALDQAITRLMGLFAGLDDPHFRERAADLHDVGRRLLEYLTKNSHPGVPALSEGCIIVTSELLSSVVAQLEGSGVSGLIVEKGGLTAHATILARALGIPMLVQVPEATRRIRSGDLLIVDALAGRVFINPAPVILHQYDQLEADLQSHRSALKKLIELPAITRDGSEIKISANIGQSGDAVAAANLNADGCGLYRTEFVFSVQDHFPSEEEQYQFYRTTAGHLQPGETVIRILDTGSDKSLPYFPLAREPNPALGSRGTRLLLEHPEILRTQLRAILRLSGTHPVALLLPMIGGLDELHAVKAAIDRVKADLLTTGHAVNPTIPLGVMIETPAAAILIERLAEEVDFFNVGTNDLVQYLLAADRLSDRSTSAYEPLHPAVLQVLAQLAKSAKPICLCGEIASEPTYTNLLIGLGFRSFSVSPNRLLEVKHAVRSTSRDEAEVLAKNVLSSRTTREIKTHLQDDWDRRKPVSSPEIHPTEPLPDAATNHPQHRTSAV